MYFGIKINCKIYEPGLNKFMMAAIDLQKH